MRPCFGNWAEPVQTMTEVAARALLERYFEHLAVERRAATLTLQAYRADLLRLIDLHPGKTLETLSPTDIRHAMARLHGAGLSGRSIARCLSSWRGLFRWLCAQGGCDADPCAGLRPPRSPKRLPEALSPDQTASLLERAPEDLLELRDKAMFELFYSSGLRLSELAGLDTRAGLDLHQALVTITGKRGKTRCVPVGSKAIEALQAWLAQRAQLAAGDEPALFVSQRGRRLSVRTIELRLDRWAQRCGLPVHVHPHMLRHSFASHLLQSSGDLRAVQDMLGHASIAATQVYTHLDFQHLARIYDAAHPRARQK